MRELLPAGVLAVFISWAIRVDVASHETVLKKKVEDCFTWKFELRESKGEGWQIRLFP